MNDYLWLIISPSKAFENLKGTQFSNRTLFIIYTISSYFVFLPNLSEKMNSTGQVMILLLYIIILPFSYFFISLFAFVYTKISQGFKGKVSLAEMRMIIVLSVIPFALKTIILLPFVWLKADASLINHSNYLTSLIFWLLSFRILIVGIAKYNKFNWIITLMVWAISTAIILGIGLLLDLLKNSVISTLLNKL